MFAKIYGFTVINKEKLIDSLFPTLSKNVNCEVPNRITNKVMGILGVTL